MNPAAESLRPDQDSMRLADCAHGAVTQLTGHIIAMIDPTQSLEVWVFAVVAQPKREGRLRERQRKIGMPDQTPWSMLMRKRRAGYQCVIAAASSV